MARTLLLGVDSVTFTLVDAFVKEGRLPFFAKCMEEGIRGDLRSTPCPLTPPAWTSLMTGVGPGTHGIYDFINTEERKNGPFFLMVSSNDVRSETIWSMASRQGKRVICLNFPAMFPVKQLDGFVVPGYITARQLRTSVHPRELYSRMKALPGFSVEHFTWDRAENRKAVNGLPSEEYESWIRYFTKKDYHLFQVSRMLMTEEKWDLAAILFEGPDRLQHLVWRFLDPELVGSLSNEWERRTRQLAIEYFVKLDAFLEELVTVAGPETRVFIVSDHGAGPSREIFYANAFLAERGYLAWKDDAAFDTDNQMTPLELRDFYLKFDWPRTKAYARSSSANGIYIRKARPGWGGVTAEEYPALRARLIDDLLNYRDPKDNEPVVVDVVVREDAFPGPRMEHAPDLTITLRDGGFLSILPCDQVVKPRKELIGMHRPHGILMACGPGIRNGERLPVRGIGDMAPTLLHSLGLPIPSSMEGRTIEELFEPSLLRANPVRLTEEVVAPRTSSDPGDGDQEMSPEDEAELVNRLKQLGYLG